MSIFTLPCRPVSPIGSTRRAVASLLLTLLPLSFLLTSHPTAAQPSTGDDTDPTVTLVLTPDTVVEGEESTLRAHLSHASDQRVLVLIRLQSVLPRNPPGVSIRYSRPNPFMIPAGTLVSGPITLAALRNGLDEPDGAVEVHSVMYYPDESRNAVAFPRPVTLTILDGDEPPTVTLNLAPASIREGGTSTVTATLSHRSSNATTVAISPPATDDYILSANRELTIPAGAKESTGLVTITAADDDVEGPGRSATVTATAANLRGIVDPADVTLTILDDDGPTLSINDVRVTEGDSGTTTLRFRVTMDRVVTREATVDWETVDGTAEAGTDYAAASGRLTFGVGETAKTVSVAVAGDDIDEPNETFTVALSNAVGATLARATGTGMIADDDHPPTVTLSLSPTSIAKNGGTSTVTASLDRPSSATTTVSVSAAPVSPATSGDYALGSNRELTIPAGTTASTGLVTIVALGGTATSTPMTNGAGFAGTATSTPMTNGAGFAETATSTPITSDRLLAKKVTVSAMAANDVGIAQPRSVTLTIVAPTRVPFFPAAADALGRAGLARVVNHSNEAGEVVIEAIDDTGVSAGTVTLPIAANAVAHLTSADLEAGNAAKGIAEGVGAGRGSWRLELTSALSITALAYVRTTDGFLAAMHDLAPVAGDVRRVAIFNPAGNTTATSRLRLVNPGDRAAQVRVVGTDDAGVTPDTSASITVPAGAAAELTAAELETAIGDGTGKWRLDVHSTEPILVMSLATSSAGHLTNLSTVPAASEEGGAHVVPLFPSASDALGRQGFVRVVNRSAVAGDVTITAHDDSEVDYEAVTLAIGAGATVNFNAEDLELGNPDKGLAGSTGPGTSAWRLALTSDLDLNVLAYVRSADGFLTSMHDVAPMLGSERWLAFFNPGSNSNQASSLRLVNPGAVDAAVTIAGVDDRGASPGTAVTLVVPAGAVRTLGAAELESGGQGFEGALGGGTGKWRLRIASDQPILAMSLLASPAGHLTNLSTAPDGGVR